MATILARVAIKIKATYYDLVQQNKLLFLSLNPQFGGQWIGHKTLCVISRNMKKTILLLILILCINSISAQRIAIDEIDKFTDNIVFKVDVSQGKTWNTSDKITKGLFDNVYLSTKLIKNEKEVLVLSNFNFQLGTIICRNPNIGKVIILFTDNVRLTLEQASDIKCGEVLDIEYYLGKVNADLEETLSVLSTKEMDSFRIYFSEGYRDFKVKENKREIIKDHYKIILERLKKH